MTYPMVFELSDELVRVNGPILPEPGTRFILMDDDEIAMLCEVDDVSMPTLDGVLSLELRNLPWPDGWSIHKNGDGYKLHRPAEQKESDR